MPGTFAADWQGYYEEAGIEVEIKSALQGEEILSATDEVSSGRADFGIGAADILLANDKGSDLVILSSIFQESAAALFSLKEAPLLDSPVDVIRQTRARTEGCADGSYLWFETLGKILTDDNGNPEQILFSTRDITERKHIEKELQEKEKRNSAILSAIPDLMFIQHRDGTYLDYHAHDKDSLYTDPDTFLGKNIKDILPETISSSFLSLFEEVLSTNELHTFEYELNIIDEKRMFEARFAPYDEDKVLSIIREITDRKKAEEALKKSEAKYRLLAENSSDVIIQYNKHFKRLYVSPSAEDLFGYALMDFEPPEILENGEYGFGLTLVEVYSKQFDGTMSISCDDETTVRVVLELE